MTWTEWIKAGQPRIVEGVCHTCKGEVYMFEPHWHKQS